MKIHPDYFIEEPLRAFLNLRGLLLRLKPQATHLVKLRNRLVRGVTDLFQDLNDRRAFLLVQPMIVIRDGPAALEDICVQVGIG